jgi:hypothetical protein
MSVHLFKALSAASLAALLAACGGGGGDSGSGSAFEWASPAYIVPAGAASKSIALTGCSGSTTLQSATLVVTSSGDMILSGVAGTATSVTELHRISVASSTYRIVEGQNDTNGPSVYVEMKKDNDEMSITSRKSNFNSSKASSPSHEISCSLAGGTTSFALTSLPSSARVASVMTSGITGIDTTEVQFGTFTGGVATWDNLSSGSPLPPPPDDQAIRFISLNVNTGAIGTSATATGTFATTAITIPTTPTSTNAYFAEEVSNGNKNFYFDVARTVGGSLQVFFERVGNLLKVYAEASYRG